MTEGEMVRWHHGLNGHEFEQAPGVEPGGQQNMPRSHEEAHKGTKKDRVWQLKWAVCAEVTRHRQHLLHRHRDSG